MPHDGSAHLDEARRQIEICNACRYCEGFCSVFPAMTRDTVFAQGDLTHLANLCHNCQGCHYACQYTDPHEFAINLPAALAEVRQDSWERLIGPAFLARAFHDSAGGIALALVCGFAALFWALTALPRGGDGFYAHLAHGAMVAIFAPAFLLPLVAVGVGLRRYWNEVGAPGLRLADLWSGFQQAATLKNLSGGQGQGCNFEIGDRYSDRRRQFHHAVACGFLLCFASTASATILHYGFGMMAPYGIFSLPKLLGIPGGVLLTIGCAGLIVLKHRADPDLSARRVRGAEYAFILLLGGTAVSGMLLYAATGSRLVAPLLALHLGSVLTLFLLLPYTKMVHGFFRLAALVAEQALARQPNEPGGRHDQ